MGHGAWCRAEHFLDFFANRGFDANALSLRRNGGSGGRERLRWTSIADYVDDVERVAASLALPVPQISLAGLVNHPNSSRSSKAKAMATSWM